MPSGDQPVCLVNFNYDLLFDHALSSYGYKPQEPKHHFSAHPLLKLFKPHRSVDFVRFVDIPDIDRLRLDAIIENREAICLRDERAKVGSPEQADNSGLGRAGFPAIAIPLQK